MDKLRRPSGLCKISELYSITTLLPNCLRLALTVTSQNPRLANGGSLRLAMRVFHPLNYPPFPGRTYPFTAPAESPFIKYLEPIANIIRIGTTAMVSAAPLAPQSCVYAVASV